MFKNIEGTKLTENSEFEPLSPYAKAKHRIHNDVIDLRERHGWNISSGILFSPNYDIITLTINHDNGIYANDLYSIFDIIIG